METEKKQVVVDSAKPIVLRPTKAAVLIDVSRSKIYDMIHRGELAYIVVGGQIRVPVAAIEKLVAESLK